MVTSSQPATLKKPARRQKISCLKNTLCISKINPLKQLLWVHLTQRIIIIIIIFYFKRPLLKSLIQVSCKSHVKITKKNKLDQKLSLYKNSVITHQHSQKSTTEKSPEGLGSNPERPWHHWLSGDNCAARDTRQTRRTVESDFLLTVLKKHKCCRPL